MLLTFSQRWRGWLALNSRRYWIFGSRGIWIPDDWRENCGKKEAVRVSSSGYWNLGYWPAVKRKETMTQFLYQFLYRWHGITLARKFNVSLERLRIAETNETTNMWALRLRKHEFMYRVKIGVRYIYLWVCWEWTVGLFVIIRIMLVRSSWKRCL